MTHGLETSNGQVATSQAPRIQSAVVAVSFPLEEGKGHQAVNVVDGVTCPGVVTGSDLSSSSGQIQAWVLGWKRGNIAAFSYTPVPHTGPRAQPLLKHWQEDWGLGYPGVGAPVSRRHSQSVTRN